MKNLVRKNILSLTPYSSARDEFSGEAEVWLDANENPFETGLNRYPDPYQRELKKKIAGMKNVPAENIFLGNGSDEVIDILFRVFCEPKEDNIITLPPTYGMYKVSAGINEVEVRPVLLKEDFQPDVEKILQTADAHTKMIFVCSPNNPTATLIDSELLIQLLENAPGLVVVDEAYIDFTEQSSATTLLEKYPNLVVMQTFSKAWGMAGVRLGMGFASQEIIGLMNKVKPPYNLSVLAQQVVLKALDNEARITEQVREILTQRQWLKEELSKSAQVEKVFDSQANFLLARCKQPLELYDFLSKRGIVVRDRSSQPLCENCLRFTVGTKEENKKLILAVNEFQFVAEK